MKKLIIASLSTIVTICFSACDFLNVTPKTLSPESYFTTESEAYSFLTGVYSPLMTEPFYGSSYLTLNCGGDDLGFYERTNATTSIICGNSTTSDPNITQFWRILYEGINRANMMLENIDRTQGISVATREQFRSEAKILRSFYYFHLIQGWGDVPFTTHSTQSVEGLSIPRSPKDGIYEFITQEIEQSIPALKRSNELSYTGRLTQSAAQAILSRIYLFWAGEENRERVFGTPIQRDKIKLFKQASHWSQQVINSQLHSLNPNITKVFMNLCSDNYNDTGYLESIWEAEEAGNRITNTAQSAGRLGNVIGLSAPDFSSNSAMANVGGLTNPGYSYYFIQNTNKLYQIYQSNGDIERRQLSIKPYNYILNAEKKAVIGRSYFPDFVGDINAESGINNKQTGNYFQTRDVAKYRREWETVLPKNKNYTPINFPIIRYSDVLLMAAEAEVQLGILGQSWDKTLADQCMHLVRSRAKINDITESDPALYLSLIKNERAMELCFEGLRRWDLIRWGDYLSAMNEIKTVYIPQTSWKADRKTSATSYYSIPNSYVYFPIPDYERSVNKAITNNNPGW